jgi:hypothetical protein
MRPNNRPISSSQLRVAVRLAALIAVVPPLAQVGYGITASSGSHYCVPENDFDLKLRFQGLRDEWIDDTLQSSSMEQIVLHPAYQRIIGMGQPALSLILEDLEREPNHWFAALAAISGENPLNPEDYGDLDRMSAAWLAWGKAKSHIA